MLYKTIKVDNIFVRPTAYIIYKVKARNIVLMAYCSRVGKAYNQINGGSANGDAFVD